MQNGYNSIGVLGLWPMFKGGLMLRAQCGKLVGFKLNFISAEFGIFFRCRMFIRFKSLKGGDSGC